MENLILLDLEKYKSRTQGVVEAGVSMGSQLKWKMGELEFESLMRMLDNLVGVCARARDPIVVHLRVPAPSSFCFLHARVTEQATLTATQWCGTNPGTRARSRSQPR